MITHFLTQKQIDECVAIVITGKPIREEYGVLEEFQPVFGDREIPIINIFGGDFKTLNKEQLKELLKAIQELIGD